ncbi:PIR Superfamily Protein [Plasmodium ovale curtisi]|uniref:PIR Superfamily Protein n=1 Tax=Plasmodium ovale curtisi TaxID=864141 RepID=A0A1A8X9V6_PLAOA|nr:PIR Superfamily Protein [Plasmodium ovale curtisi]SBT01399.1 PIR Superfamily Protein [Plasmodium ovale curtisi]
MTCNKNADRESYGFFVFFDNYSNRANVVEKIVSVKPKTPEKPNYAEQLNPGKKINVSCSDFSKYAAEFYSKIQSPDILCEKFREIYNSLSNSNWGKKKEEYTKGEEKLGNNDWAFINYWLNDTLRGTDSDPPICVKDFYKSLRKMDEDYFKIEYVEDKLYNIEKNDFKKMKDLYYLYDMKEKISNLLDDNNETNIKALCPRYEKECNEKYRDVIINCRDDCNDFFSAIAQFKKEYNQDLVSLREHTYLSSSYELQELPDYISLITEQKIKEFTRTIFLPVLFLIFGLFSILLFFNKFLPCRKYLIEKIKRNKRIIFHVDEGEESLPSHAFENDDTISDNGEYNIGYYSTLNS